MRRSFPWLHFSVFVGIGGGVPSPDYDIRRGDVVISQPADQHGGVVQYDFGRTEPQGHIKRIGSLNTPPTLLLNALATLRSEDLRGKTAVNTHLSAFSAISHFARPDSSPDTLFVASSQHCPGANCVNCRPEEILQRAARTTSDPVLFYGNIASGNQVMEDGLTRDRISNELGGIMCFEMEAAGLMNNFPCLVIRGISDYADAHKNDAWQPYAAATAAACAKDLLRIIPHSNVTDHSKQEGRK
jgi:nucleoside phosphorylase